MNRKGQLALFVAGGSLFAFLIHHIGFGNIVQDARRTGWMTIPIVLVYLPVYMCNAAAWQLILSRSPARPRYWKTLVIIISGFAINYVTPIVSLGGEPYKIAAVAPWTGPRRATSSIILATMLHALSHLMIWLTAVVVALILLPHNAATVISLGVLGLVLLLLISFVFTRHREGVLEDAVSLLAKVPLIRRVARKWQQRGRQLARIDRQIAELWVHDRVRFFLALGFEYLGRAIGMLEFMLIFAALGRPIGYWRAFLTGSFTSLITNILFFVPLGLGSKEGSLFGVAQVLGQPGSSGVFASLVSRLREMFWITVGLSLIWASGTPTNVRRRRRPLLASAGAAASRNAPGVT